VVIKMSWEGILKNYDKIDNILEELKESIKYSMENHTPESVKNEEGKFIKENVEEALGSFQGVEHYMRELKNVIADYLQTIGLWDGSYGYSISPQLER
tara:strand:+ start:227 stop:520 length:294 start_codon:yes stop_codon:yes gene_type:complete